MAKARANSQTWQVSMRWTSSTNSMIDNDESGTKIMLGYVARCCSQLNLKGRTYCTVLLALLTVSLVPSRAGHTHQQTAWLSRSWLPTITLTYDRLGGCASFLVDVQATTSRISSNGRSNGRSNGISSFSHSLLCGKMAVTALSQLETCARTSDLPPAPDLKMWRILTNRAHAHHATNSCASTLLMAATTSHQHSRFSLHPRLTGKLQHATRLLLPVLKSHRSYTYTTSAS